MNPLARTVLLLILTLCLVVPASAQTPDRIETFHLAGKTLGDLVERSANIVLLEVVRVEEGRSPAIHYLKLNDLKGRGMPATVRHAKDFDRHTLQTWARPGRRAIAFYQDGHCAVCLGHEWYCQAAEKANETYILMEPQVHRRTLYVGPVARLESHVRDIVAGKDVIITVESYRSALHALNDRDWVRGEHGRICRVRAGRTIVANTAAILETGKHFVGLGAGTREDVPGWIEALRAKDPELRAHACEDLATLGHTAKDAIPALSAALKDNDRHVRLHAAGALARIDRRNPKSLHVLIAGLSESESVLRIKAARLLGALESQAGLACPALLVRLSQDTDTDVRAAAARALGQIGPEITNPKEQQTIIRGLIKSSQTKNKDQVLGMACASLKSFGSSLAPSVPELYPLLATTFEPAGSTFHWQREIADLITRAGPGALPYARGDHSWSTAVDFVPAYDQMGPRANAAFFSVRAGLSHEDPFALMVGRTLATIDPVQASPILIPLLKKALAEEQDKFFHTHDMAIEVLRSLPQGIEPCLPELIHVIRNSESRNLRRSAIRIIGQLGPRGRDAWGDLSLELKSDNLRRDAAIALWRIDPGNRTVLRVLDQSLKTDPDQAYTVLDEIGTGARPLVPTILQVMRSTRNPTTRIQLAASLMKIVEPMEEGGLIQDERTAALEVLRTALQSKPDLEAIKLASETGFGVPGMEWGVHLQAVKSIGELGPLSRPLLPELLRLLEIEQLTLDVAEAVQRIGMRSPQDRQKVIRALKPLLESDSLYSRAQSAALLCRLQPEKPDGMNELIRILDSDGFDVLSILEELGSHARPAIPALLKALRRNPHDYWYIVNAIHKIDPAAAAKHHLP